MELDWTGAMFEKVVALVRLRSVFMVNVAQQDAELDSCVSGGWVVAQLMEGVNWFDPEHIYKFLSVSSASECFSERTALLISRWPPHKWVFSQRRNVWQGKCFIINRSFFNKGKQARARMMFCHMMEWCWENTNPIRAFESHPSI